MSTAPQAPSEEQVLAEMRHWIEQAVIGLNLCPFAKSVYVKNQVRIVVSQARNIDAFLDDLDRELELLKDTPAEQVDTTLLVHPTLFPDFFVFNDFLDLVDEVVEEHELEGIVQVAPFHPAFHPPFHPAFVPALFEALFQTLFPNDLLVRTASRHLHAGLHFLYILTKS